MTSQLIESHRENAVIVTSDEAIKQKAAELLKSNCLPVGLIPLGEITELGYNAATGFFWALRKKKLEHFNKAINRKITFDVETSAFLEERRMRKVTGVKSKELMLWVSTTDIRIDDPASGKIIFTATAGITKTFPVSAFEEEEAAAEPVKAAAAEPVKAAAAEPVKEAAAVEPVKAAVEPVKAAVESVKEAA